jgi:hypothetical protein
VNTGWLPDCIEKRQLTQRELGEIETQVSFRSRSVISPRKFALPLRVLAELNGMEKAFDIFTQPHTRRKLFHSKFLIMAWTAATQLTDAYRHTACFSLIHHDRA